MRQFFITVIGTIVGLFLAVILFIFLIALIGAAAAPDTSKASGNILDIDLRGGLIDQSAGESLFGGEAPSVVGLVRKIAHAKTDEDIDGIFIRANPYGMAPARAEELRLALLDFKSDGKFIITHAQGFEGTSPFNYMAISPSDEIWLQDTAGFSIAGVRSEVGFMGGTFEKYGAEANFVKFHEYKNAVNGYTESGFTAPHKEALTSMITSLYDSAITNIAADRALGSNDTAIDMAARSARLRQLFETAPHSAEDAKAAGLIDTLGHYYAAREHAKARGGEGSEFVSISGYNVPFRTGPVIALIGGQGAVVTGSSEAGGLFSSGQFMGSDTVSKAITKAAEDDSVKAIIFRVDSPGGSAIASDQMWDAVNRAKANGKPVIVSMGQYAASGGYYVAANADKIVAMPTTLTGSIGVYGGKLALSGTYDKVGYNVESIDVGGDFTAAYSSDDPWTPELREKVRGSMEDIYVDFTSRVSDGRDIPIERVREIAKGRVWTGAQAKEIGLVDELGGLMTAIELAKAAGGIDADKTVRLKRFPKPLTPAEQIEQLFNGTVSAGNDLAALSELVKSPEVQALLEARQALAQTGQDTSLKADIPAIK